MSFFAGLLQGIAGGIAQGGIDQKKQKFQQDAALYEHLLGMSEKFMMSPFPEDQATGMDIKEALSKIEISRIGSTKFSDVFKIIRSRTGEQGQAPSQPQVQPPVLNTEGKLPATGQGATANTAAINAAQGGFTSIPFPQLSGRAYGGPLSFRDKAAMELFEAGSKAQLTQQARVEAEPQIAKVRAEAKSVQDAIDKKAARDLQKKEFAEMAATPEGKAFREAYGDQFNNLMLGVQSGIDPSKFGNPTEIARLEIAKYAQDTDTLTTTLLGAFTGVPVKDMDKVRLTQKAYDAWDEDIKKRFPKGVVDGLLLKARLMAEKGELTNDRLGALITKALTIRNTNALSPAQMAILRSQRRTKVEQRAKLLGQAKNPTMILRKEELEDQAAALQDSIDDIDFQLGVSKDAPAPEDKEFIDIEDDAFVQQAGAAVAVQAGITPQEGSIVEMPGDPKGDIEFASGRWRRRKKAPAKKGGSSITPPPKPKEKPLPAIPKTSVRFQ